MLLIDNSFCFIVSEGIDDARDRESDACDGARERTSATTDGVRGRESGPGSGVGSFSFKCRGDKTAGEAMTEDLADKRDRGDSAVFSFIGLLYAWQCSRSASPS